LTSAGAVDGALWVDELVAGDTVRGEAINGTISGVVVRVANALSVTRISVITGSMASADGGLSKSWASFLAEFCGVSSFACAVLAG
jgi:hypothetical protein